MRRAQSVRHYPRPSVAQGVDDLGILQEGEESVEDVLRKQLLDKERECDKVRVSTCYTKKNLFFKKKFHYTQIRFCCQLSCSSPFKRFKTNSSNDHR